MALRALMRTRDIGAITFAASLLESDDIYYLIADQNYAAGGVGIMPVRLMAPESDYERAKELLLNSGIDKRYFVSGPGEKE